MSTDIPFAEPSEWQPSPAMADHLGYLLKHVQIRFFELTTASLTPFGINGREAALLGAIDDPSPLSQGEVAARMGVDRTTMVALIDELQDKGLVRRRQDPHDRRRNVVELTDVGRTTLRRAAEAGEQAERLFLSPLSDGDSRLFKSALRTLLFGRAADPRGEPVVNVPTSQPQ